MCHFSVARLRMRFVILHADFNLIHFHSAKGFQCYLGFPPYSVPVSYTFPAKEFFALLSGLNGLSHLPLYCNQEG